MGRQLVRVGIIGGGASGLAQLKQLLDAFARPRVREEKELEVVLFEKNPEIGGVWLADENAYKSYLSTSTSSTQHPNGGDNGDHLHVYPPRYTDPSPMYEGLRTNLPYDLMAFRDLPMTSDLPTFPTRAQIQEYLIAYARTFDLYRHIKLRTAVRRLYHSPEAQRRWTIEYASAQEGGKTGVEKMEVDFVSCANGHYADGWIPPTPGLGSFVGEVIHSRFFRSAEDYAGQKVLVVGSFASGGDISRLLAAYNLDLPDGQLPTPPPEQNGRSSSQTQPRKTGGIDVHISCSAKTPFSVDDTEGGVPWGKYVKYHPLIKSIETSPAPWPYTPPETPSTSQNIQSSTKEKKSIIYFEDGTQLAGVDTIIYATGYSFAMPFAKTTDEPWASHPLLEGSIGVADRHGGEEWEVGGMMGQGVKGLDGSMLFMQGDQSICFPTLQYQVVPFPLAETQTRLSSLLWAGLLPSFPSDPTPPHNPSNPYSSPSEENHSSPGSGNGNAAPPRKVLKTKQKLVFGAPYEWTYQEWLMGYMREADPDGVEPVWQGIEGFRRERRADTALRKRTLGY